MTSDHTDQARLVQDPRSAHERADAANTSAWRTSAVACIILLLTGVLVWVIPIVLVATAIGNSRRTRAAHEGRLDDLAAPPRLREDGAFTWLLAVPVALLGAVFTYGGLLGGMTSAIVIGLVFIAGAAAMRPWRYRLTLR